MFVLYGLVIGLLVGYATGGRLGRLAHLPILWPWLALGAFAAQAVLFALPTSGPLDAVGPPLYVATTALVLATVVRNLALPGLALMAAGGASNLAAIVANDGHMPADPNALALAGRTVSAGFSNSITVPDPRLAPLTDIFALPSWVPFANVFSVGDVLIAAGIAVVVAWGMHYRPGSDAIAWAADSRK